METAGVARRASGRRRVYGRGPWRRRRPRCGGGPPGSGSKSNSWRRCRRWSWGSRWNWGGCGCGTGRGATGLAGTIRVRDALNDIAAAVGGDKDTPVGELGSGLDGSKVKAVCEVCEESREGYGSLVDGGEARA